MLKSIMLLFVLAVWGLIGVCMIICYILKRRSKNGRKIKRNN